MHLDNVVKTEYEARRLVYSFFAFIFCIALLQNIEFRFLGVTITPERILSIPLVLLSISLILIKGKMPKIKMVDVLFMSWLVVGLISSSFSDVHSWSLKMYVLLLLASCFYFTAALLTVNPVIFFKTKIFSFLLFLLGPLLVLIYFLNFLELDLPDFIRHLLQAGSGGIRIRGTIYEANLYGSYLITFILLSWALIFKNIFLKIFLIIFLLIGMLLSFSRGPWIGFVLSAFVYLILIHPRPYTLEGVSKKLFFLGLISILILVAAVSFYSTYMDYELIGRIHSINTRLTMWSLSLQYIIENPLIGNGLFSFSALNPEAPELVGSETHRSAWISNLPLAVLHDTGAIGFLLFFVFILVILYTNWFKVRESIIRNQAENQESRISAALYSGVFGLLVTSMTIPSHLLAFFWIMVALLRNYNPRYSYFNDIK